MATMLTGSTEFPLPASTAPADRRGRLIAVAVQDADRDAAALAWAAFDAVAGVDSVHVVHCYIPLHVDDCSWAPVTRARDDRRQAAKRIAATAVQRLRAMRPGLTVDGSAIAGLPSDVVIELSSVVDVVVVGADRPGRSIGTRHVALRVQEHARCPVVCVPAGHRLPDDGPPVTVVAGADGIPEAAMRFAAGYAHRHGVALQVSRAWADLHEGDRPGATWLAHQQEELDAQLASWRAAHPYVPISARIELEDDWLPGLAAHSGLLVVPGGSLAVDQRSADPAWLHCPTVVVP